MIAFHHDDGNDTALADLAGDLTPMLDILFILLVFFLLTAGTTLRALDLELPKNVSEDLQPLDAPKHVLLQIKQDGFKIDDRALANFDALKAALPDAMRAHPEYSLIIASDRRVEVDRLLGVLTHLQSMGISATNILLNREEVQ